MEVLEHSISYKEETRSFYCDLLACIQSILSSPLMKDHLQFLLLCVFNSFARAMWIYSEWLTGNVAWSMQVSHWIKFISVFPYLYIGSVA